MLDRFVHGHRLTPFGASEKNQPREHHQIHRITMMLRTVSITFGAYIVILLLFCDIRTAHAQRTVLDNFINEYRTLRYGLFKFIGRSDTSTSYFWNLKRQVIAWLSGLFSVFGTPMTLVPNMTLLVQFLKSSHQNVYLVLFLFRACVQTRRKYKNPIQRQRNSHVIREEPVREVQRRRRRCIA